MIPYPVIMGTAQGLLFDPQQLSNFLPQLRQSNLTQIQFPFAISTTGDITAFTSEIINDYGVVKPMNINPLIVTNGMYVYSSRMPSLLLSLSNPINDGSSIRTISASISNWGNLASLPINPTNGSGHAQFINTTLEKNFKVFRNTFPDISIIDINLTNYYNASDAEQNALIAFILMLNTLNFGFTFSLNADTVGDTTMTPPLFAIFLAELLITVGLEIKNAQNSQSLTPLITGLNPNLVKSLNPIYNIGTSSIKYPPSAWAEAINIKDFSIDGFILPGFFAIGNPVVGGSTSGDPASVVQSKIKNFSVDACVGGGFFATIDHVLGTNDPNNTLQDYANALCMGLNEIALSLTVPTSLPYTLKFVPVNGIPKTSPFPFPPATSLYAFCSPVFTLIFAATTGTPVPPPLPLELNVATGQFNIFPQPMDILNPNFDWVRDGTQNTFILVRQITLFPYEVKIDYDPLVKPKSLTITLKIIP